MQDIYYYDLAKGIPKYQKRLASTFLPTWNVGEKIKPWEPDVIVGITRGGLVPMAIASQVFPKAKLRLISTTSYNEERVQKDLEITYQGFTDVEIYGKHILVCDDILDTGKTLLEVYRRLKYFHAESILCAVLVHKGKIQDEDDPGFPFCYAEKMDSKDDWCVFPWEFKQ